MKAFGNSFFHFKPTGTEGSCGRITIEVTIVNIIATGHVCATARIMASIRSGVADLHVVGAWKGKIGRGGTFHLHLSRPAGVRVLPSPTNVIAAAANSPEAF
ncbi:MAG: hypothetical protein A2W25_06195 [candidate division Zixibacteria bacterium RBG_16_53_22]|nr:MAG: hypothetical protein A2W25_06195 [candidate division Zixibacteria bacterium RBG_16_53_22]